MMKWIIAIVVVVAGVSFLVWYNKNEMPVASVSPTVTSTASTTESTSPSVTPTTSASTSPKPSASTYTMAQVSQHNSKASCYTVIEGSVYDLTKWISLHPGGQQAILSICGKDGTAAFTAQHDHAQKQQDILVTYKIGTLAK